MCDNKYSVRCWSAFYNDWVMIPLINLTRQEAIDKAKELSDNYDCGEDGWEEMQVWVECLGGTAHKMVGYVELDIVETTETAEVWDWVFVESFS